MVAGPKFLRFFLPVIEILREMGGAGKASDVRANVINHLGIPTEEAAVTLKSGVSRVGNQVDWARHYLKASGFLAESTRGTWQLSPLGLTCDLAEIDPMVYFKAVQAMTKDNEKLDSVLVQVRLQQWIDEATNLDNPNYSHADLDHAANIYRQVTPLVQKLREDTDQFEHADVRTLIGVLNSGERMKNVIADNNKLPALCAALLALLDGEGSVAERIREAKQRIHGAGAAILGELYGWVHADDAPLFNACATDALQYLGYTFGAGDYDAFVAAHEAFKQIYEKEVGHLRPDLPLNLEIDKLYNVIDKVDLASESLGGTADATLANIFIDSEEMHWALDLIATMLRHVGIEENGDERFAITLPKNGNALHVSVGNMLILGFKGARQGEYRVRILFIHQESPYDDDAIEYEFKWPSTHDFKSYLVPVNTVRPLTDGVRDKHLQAVKAYVDSHQTLVRSSQRGIHQDPIGRAVFDKSLREALYTSDSAPTSGSPSRIAETFKGFSADAFTFMAELKVNNNKEWMEQNRERWKGSVLEPMRTLFADLGPVLKQKFDPYLVPALEIRPTAHQVLARIYKNWAAKPGNLYHDYYWGAFYRESMSKQTDAQLFVVLFANVLRFGFFVGQLARPIRDRFRRRVLDEPSSFLALINKLQLVNDFEFVHTHKESNRKIITISSAANLQEWVESGDYDLLQPRTPKDVIAQGPALTDLGQSDESER